MKLTKTKKRLIVILAVVLVILLAAFLSLWLTGVLHYWHYGMLAIHGENGNYRYTTQMVYNTQTAEIYLTDLDRNRGTVLFEDGNCRLIVEDAEYSEKKTYLYLSVRCYADYDFNHTTYYLPALVRNTGQVQAENQTVALDCIGNGPSCYNYYSVTLSIPNLNELTGETATLTLSDLIRYSYVRTAIGTTLI